MIIAYTLVLVVKMAVAVVVLSPVVAIFFVSVVVVLGIRLNNTIHVA